MKETIDAHTEALAKKILLERGEDIYKEGVTLQPKIYSLYTYFKTFPKDIQEHPGFRTVYLGLEYSQPDLTYEQKEQTLNEAALKCLPMDKCTYILNFSLTCRNGKTVIY